MRLVGGPIDEIERRRSVEYPRLGEHYRRREVGSEREVAVLAVGRVHQILDGPFEELMRHVEDGDDILSSFAQPKSTAGKELLFDLLDSAAFRIERPDDIRLLEGRG